MYQLGIGVRIGYFVFGIQRSTYIKKDLPSVLQFDLAFSDFDHLVIRPCAALEVGYLWMSSVYTIYP